MSVPREVTGQGESVSMWCDLETFCPTREHDVRWLHRDDDFPLAATAWRARGQELSREEWLSFHREGYEYCAVVEGAEVLARAAAWRYSDPRWEVAAVWTRDDR